MAYVKNTWVDQDVQRPKTYEVTTNQDGSITLTDSFGLVTELGTPVNEVNMNHIEDGIAGCAIRKYSLTETFDLGEWVLGGTGEDEGIYKSLISNNVGNAITDETKWTKVEMGGGSSHNIGEIVASTIPLIDAGLHLLDGSLLQYGSYQAFIDYIADLYDSGEYTAIFDTEANWQTAVTTYGVCGKFVYDSVNNTVRLPKWGNQAFTKSNISTASTLPVKGTGKSMGFSDGLHETGLSKNASGLIYSDQALGSNNGTSVSTTETVTNNVTVGVTPDGSKSGIVADVTSLTNDYGVDCYYYIVVATTTKTDIQVDIDEIATDLNGKADVDLSNTTPASSFASTLNTAGIRTVVYQTTSNGCEIRVWSDGFKEIFCKAITNASAAAVDISYPTNSTQYAFTAEPMLLVNQYSTATATTGQAYRTEGYARSATGFSVYFAAANASISYYACGY